MRVSNRGAADRLLLHLQTSQARLAETQARVGSGRRINKPSDDPFGASRALTQHSQLDMTAQYQRNVQLANAELGVTESSLDALGKVLARAQELSVQADSSGIDGAARQQIAAEVDRLVQEAVTIGNTSYGGRRIFGGYQSGQPPFQPDLPEAATVVNYAGDAGVVQREIGDGERLAVNLPGQSLFDGVFSSLIAFREALQVNDRAGIATASGAISNEVDGALQARGEIGARVRRLEMASERLDGDEIRLREQISTLEDADLTQEVVELQMRDTALQAALSATGRSLSTSLLDFLR